MFCVALKLKTQDLGITVAPPPPNTADLGTNEKAAVFGNGRYWESYITYKTLFWDLEMGGGIGGGRQYWEGQYWGGDDCIPKTRFLSHFQESKTKKDLVEKIKSLMNTLYLITSETLER